MNAFVLPLVIFSSVSLFCMAMLVFQFFRIHNKRIELLKAFDSEGELLSMIKSEKIQSYCVVFLYIVLTIGISAISSYLFFVRPHWL